MIKLGLPSKGRLQQACIEWFAERGVKIERAAEELLANAEMARRIGQLRAEMVTRQAAAMPLLELRRHEEALAQLIGVMQAPVAKFVRTMAEPPAKFARTVAAGRAKLQAS